MRHFARRHAGWPRGGIALSATLVAVLWGTGLLLDVWPAEQAALLLPWQSQLRHSALVAHGIGAWVFCLFAGRWAWPHVALMWRRAVDSTWWLGLLATSLALAAAVTGVLLLYGPGEGREASVAAHWWTAVGWPALLALHVRRLVQRRAAPVHEPLRRR